MKEILKDLATELTKIEPGQHDTAELLQNTFLETLKKLIPDTSGLAWSPEKPTIKTYLLSLDPVSAAALISTYSFSVIRKFEDANLGVLNTLVESLRVLNDYKCNRTSIEYSNASTFAGLEKELTVMKHREVLVNALANNDIKYILVKTPTHTMEVPVDRLRITMDHIEISKHDRELTELYLMLSDLTSLSSRNNLLSFVFENK